MYRAYLVPDATQYNNRAAMYQAKLLLWDPRSESDAYAVIGPKFKGEVNKAESFEFTVLPANIRYEQINKKISVIIVYDDDEWIFEGVVSDCPKDFFKQMKVTCSGPLSYLCDSVQAPDEKNAISIPTASGNTYVQVPKQWYNNANPHSQGWQERSDDVDDRGRYTYNLTSDTSPNTNKTYYYVSSGDNQNHSGSTLTKKAATKETIEAHLDRLLEVHNSQVDAFKCIYLDRCVGDSTEHEFKSSNYRETWSAIKSDIIEQYGRYITVKMDDHYTLKLNYLELNDMDPHTTPETSIVFTENMIEMSESDDSDDDIFTVLVPIGKNNLTVSGVTGHDSPAYNDNRMVDPYVKSWGDNKRYVVVSRYAVGKYGYIVKTQTFSDASSASELWTAAVKYIKNNFDAHTEYEVKGIDKFILGENNTRITVGKKCRVKSGWHGVDEKDLYVISAEIDMVSPDNDTYKIGIPTSDREAVNKTLTGQTTSSSTNSANSSSNLSSGLNTIASWLENYFSENEGWLELHNKFRNQVESENGMFLTRFEQDEEHINMMAQKVFGVQGEDGVADSDAGWILIPKPPYRKNGNGVEDYYESSSSDNTTYKVPSEHNWYEKGSDGKYRLSTQDTRVTQAQVNDPSVNFYVMRLATRYSDIDVGPGGIKARVDGNYETSTYCSSWIHMNEDEILALTGHLYVDEDGHVHVTSGSGMRTDHEETASTLKYIQVARSSYTPTTNPKNKHWYERKLDTSNAWLGQGQADVETNDDYYQSTNDTEIDRTKYYYYKSYIRETFVSEFGVYDEDNLTAGVMAKVINNPTYHKVPMTELNNHKIAGHSPNALGWYEYNAKTGTYGITLDTEIGDITNTKYYTVTNNMESWSYLTGDHIIIGKVSSEYVQVPPSEYPGSNPSTAGWYEQRSNGTYFRSNDTSANTSKMYYRKQETYNGMNEQTQSRVARYIEGHNLDGTITEIASDVLYVHALFTEYLDVLSHKIFGVDDQDSGFVAVTNTAGKNPVAEGWYELVNGKYVPTSDDAVKSGKTYYVRRITERITNFNVDENGIHGIVEGNYKRSTNSASWIEANEDQILAITGHIYVDENGQVIIKNGSGFRTGHTDPVSTHKYVQVKKSDYSGSPSSKGWYERKLDANGKWLGEGQSNSQTSDAYYERSTDTSCSLNKYYYTLATTEEEFYSDYGVYDENNLKAGIIARMINNPQYEPMPSNWYSGSHNPKSEGLYVLTDKGSMSATNDTSIVSGTTYYKKTNDSTGWTAVKGEHVVIGYTDGYSGLDEATKAKVRQYLGDNLNGTVTEIASDVVTVNTLIAKYISADSIDAGDIVVGTWLRTDWLYAHKAYIDNNLEVDGTFQANTIKVGVADAGQSSGYFYHNVANNLINHAQSSGEESNLTVKPTVTGDEVKLAWYTIDGGKHSVTFTKPASLGSVTWSSGNKTLTAKTVGGADFLVGEIKNFAPSGQEEAMAMNNAGYLATETTGYSQVYGLYYTKKVPTYTNGSISGYTDTAVKTMLFKTPKNRYPDAVSTIKTWSNTDKTDGDNVDLGKDESIKIYARYKTEVQYDAESGDDDSKKGNTDKSGITVTAVSAYNTGWDNARLKMDWPSTMQGLIELTTLTIKYPSATVGLQDTTTFKLLDADTKGSSGYVRVYRDYVDNDHRGNMIAAIQVGDWYTTGYDDAVGTLAISPSSNQSLGWGDSATVKAQVTKRDGTTSEKSISVTGKSKPSISSPASATAPEGVTPTSLSYGTTYEVHLVDGSTNAGNSVYFKAPSDNSTDPESGSISIDTYKGTNDAGYTEQGSGYTQLFTNVTFTNQKWYRFKVTCSGDTMVTTTKNYAIYVKTS